MNFQVIGEVVEVGEVEVGTTKKGVQWKGQNFVIKAYDKEQHIIALRLRGSRVDEYHPMVGEALQVSFEIESRPRMYKDAAGNEKKTWESTNDAYYIRQYTDNPSDAMRMQDLIHGVAESFRA